MAGPSRIDELRKKFDENPRRYFAPLANEYRKIGDFEQAIFICQEFLPQQPGHMSGHIVYGQALFETGRHDDARSVFETALALDPENLIALRHLGDIARARGDTETARAWYLRVLESDPRNDEIAGILTSLDNDPGTAAAAPSAAPQQAAPSSSGEAHGESITLESAISSAAPGSAAAATEADHNPSTASPAPTIPESTFDDVAKLFTATSPSGLASGPLQLIHEGEDLLGRPDDHTSAEAQPIRTPGPSSGFSPFGGGTEDVAPSGFHATFLDGLTSEAPAEPPPPVEVTPPAVVAEEAPAPVAEKIPAAPTPPSRPAPQASAAQSQPQPSPEPPAAPSADTSTAFVTETMAELYLQQGHRDQALEVYRKLVQLHPNDANLSARLDSLERTQADQLRGVAAIPTPAPAVVADSGPTIREFLGLIAEFRPRGSRPPDDLPAPDLATDVRGASSASTVGGSIHNLFAEAEQRGPADQNNQTNHDAIAASAAHDRVEAEQPLPGRPATPATNELSLDHVFRHATPATGGGAQSGFSFDQFFSQQAQKDVAAADAEPANEAGPGQGDDIQQFNAWLEGLKKT
ncbi:MAG TPA: tetratricopeptide repeat protein [Gemmatimonadaceae bacterium]|jgi:tetratricopeptide (TPR) repeat protein|nr:tetratricopeptide repeat protein [Gemmatimonadaceae bacterium]